MLFICNKERSILQIHIIRERQKMKTKYENCIKAIARMMVERRYSAARHHISRLMKHYDEMTDTEIEVVEELRIVAFNK